MVISGVQRYESNTLNFAEMAHARGKRINLFADQSRTPIHALSDFSCSSRIVVPLAWDSAGMSLLLTEAIISAVQDLLWADMRSPMEALETMIGQRGFFKNSPKSPARGSG